MENENTGTATVESINAEIAQVRSEQKPFVHSRRADSRLNDLYRQRQGLIDGDEPGNEHDNENTTPGQETDAEGNVPDQPKGRSRLSDPRPNSDAMEAAQQAGIDTSNLDPNEMTDVGKEGLHHLTLIEKGDLQTLGPELSKAATELGMPASTIQFLEQFTSTIAQPGDPLSDAILKTIAEFIYEARS